MERNYLEVGKNQREKRVLKDYDKFNLFYINIFIYTSKVWSRLADQYPECTGDRISDLDQARFFWTTWNVLEAKENSETAGIPGLGSMTVGTTRTWV